MLTLCKKGSAVDKALVLSCDKQAVESVNTEFLFDKYAFISHLIEHYFTGEFKLGLEDLDIGM